VQKTIVIIIRTNMLSKALFLIIREIFPQHKRELVENKKKNKNFLVIKNVHSVHTLGHL